MDSIYHGLHGLCNGTVSVRPSVCPSHLSHEHAAGLLLGAALARDIDLPIIRRSPATAASLLLWARRAGDIDRQRRLPGAAAARRSAAKQCEQYHVVS